MNRRTRLIGKIIRRVILLLKVAWPKNLFALSENIIVQCITVKGYFNWFEKSIIFRFSTRLVLYHPTYTYLQLRNKQLKTLQKLHDFKLIHLMWLIVQIKLPQFIHPLYSYELCKFIVSLYNRTISNHVHLDMPEYENYFFKVSGYSQTLIIYYYLHCFVLESSCIKYDLYGWCWRGKALLTELIDEWLTNFLSI